MIKFLLPLMLMGTQVYAGGNFQVSGKVMRVENGHAIVQGKSGITEIPMRRLAKEDAKNINMAAASKKEVVLYLPARVLEKSK